MQVDATRIASHCHNTLSLAHAEYGQEYGYQSLPLCVIDAVWSIGVRYEGVKNVVRRYCHYFSLPDPWRPDDSFFPQATAEHSVPVMLAEMERVGVEEFTDKVFQNHQRTSARSGILKAAAVYRFAAILVMHHIHFLKDVPAFGKNMLLERQLLSIPGQASGKSMKYFFMLCGDDKLMKPDRMTLTFMSDILSRGITDAEAQSLLAAACELLAEDFPLLTPRLLDHEIWKYQRSL